MSRESFTTDTPIYEAYYFDDILSRYQVLGSYNKSVSRSPLVRNKKDLAGWRSPSPYVCTATETSAITGSIDVVTYRKGQVGPVYSENFSGSLYNFCGNAPVLTGSAITMPSANDARRAEVECLLKVRNKSINLLVTFAERQKTIDMVLDRTTRVYRAYSMFRKGNPRGAMQMLGIDKRGKKTASSWLELQYGWLPLLSDIHGGYEFLTGRRSTKGMLFNVSRTISSSDSQVTSFLAPAYTKTTNVNADKKTKVSLWYTVNYPALAEASKLGLLNPVEVAWELVPFSFVLDWILPVGNVLGALSATAGVTFKGGTITTSVRSTSTTQVIPKNNVTWDNFTKQRSGEGQATLTYFKMDRKTYSGSPIPTPYVKNPLSVGHALNALALLRGFFK